MIDCETGEVITLTKSKWNNKEGRVNLDFHGVIGTGTGKIDISSLIIPNSNYNNNYNNNYNKQEQEEDYDYKDEYEGEEEEEENNDSYYNRNRIQNRSSYSERNERNRNRNRNENNGDVSPSQYSSHPLILKFLEDGPLNPYIHTRWNPKTGKIDPIKSKKSKKNDNIIKVETNVIQDEIEEESLNDQVVIDPLAFFNRKKKLGGVVDLAIQQKSNLSSADSSAYNTENSNIVSLPQILVNKNTKSSNNSINSVNINKNNKNKNNGVDSPSQSSIASKNTSNSNNDQNICNQIFAIVNEMDDISHPKPYNFNTMSREEKATYNRQTNERKLVLLKHCEEIAALKGRMARELRQAIQDEEIKEKRRIEAIKDLKNPNSKFSKEMKKRHREERERAKIYIRTLQHDNEVLFLTKLQEYNLIW